MHMRSRFILVSLLVAATSVGAAIAATTHPFNVHDLVMMDRISSPQISPDGAKVVFVVRKTDLAANRGRTDLWLMNSDGSGLTQLTTNPAGDSSPVWAPDGRTIYFLSTRSGSSQIWKIESNGGEARQVTTLPLDVANLLVSPDGSKLAFSMDVFPGTSVDETAKRLKGEEESPATGRIYDSLMVRHWDTWEDHRRSHVFVMPAAGGAPVDVMKAMDADSPSQPFGGPEEITFTPDSKSIVFTAKNVGREEAWSTNYDLYVVPADASAAPKNLTDANDAWDTTPVFSPDGKTLAYLAMERPGFEADRYRIRLMSWPAGTTKTLTEAWDRSPDSFLFDPDGKTIYATAENLGNHSLFAIDAKTGTARTLVSQGTVHSPGVAGNGKNERIVFGMDNLRSPVQLYSVRTDGSDQKRLTDFNADRLASIAFGDPEQMTFKGWNDDTVYAWVVKPANFDPSKKYPVAFLIHGGPQGSFQNDFHYRWNPQIEAGDGYAAVMVDFHGSTGYGQAFTDAISGHWGDRPLEDLQKGLAAAIAKYPWMDGDRVAALGASYGGFMINWIEGAWPDRFRALVSHDGVFDQRMMYYATEELWFPAWEQEGLPWVVPQNYEKFNPVNLVDKWKTPMLVVHSANDFRIPESQGLGVFTALQRRGIPSKLLYFPDESHFVLKPANSILWHDTVLAWIDKWTK
ncbi:MAG: S9 family peptidase [Thermoanaerobaculia bacterium]